jgi:hypothetical protein
MVKMGIHSWWRFLRALGRLCLWTFSRSGEVPCVILVRITNGWISPLGDMRAVPVQVSVNCTAPLTLATSIGHGWTGKYVIDRVEGSNRSIVLLPASANHTFAQHLDSRTEGRGCRRWLCVYGRVHERNQ